jgi:hypothetical protein
MKAKLIKKKEGWYNLYNGEIGIGSTHEELQLQGYKLSLKNCQAIENGYDLYELAKENYHKFWSVVDESEMLNHTFGYVEGFQKAIELMDDKKFSEEDVMLGWDAGVMSKSVVFSMEQLEPHRESYQRNLKPASLQQTEWDVEVEMEVVPDFYSRSDKDGSIFTSNKKEIPKLDATGCLILKRI